MAALNPLISALRFQRFAEVEALIASGHDSNQAISGTDDVHVSAWTIAAGTSAAALRKLVELKCEYKSGRRPAWKRSIPLAAAAILNNAMDSLVYIRTRIWPADQLLGMHGPVFTPLHAAVWTHNLPALRMIAPVSDFDAPDVFGCSAAMVAAHLRDLEALESLLSVRSSSVASMLDSRQSLLHVAAGSAGIRTPAGLLLYPDATHNNQRSIRISQCKCLMFPYEPASSSILIDYLSPLILTECSATDLHEIFQRPSTPCPFMIALSEGNYEAFQALADWFPDYLPSEEGLGNSLLALIHKSVSLGLDIVCTPIVAATSNIVATDGVQIAKLIVQQSDPVTPDAALVDKLSEALAMRAWQRRAAAVQYWARCNGSREVRSP